MLARLNGLTALLQDFGGPLTEATAMMWVSGLYRQCMRLSRYSLFFRKLYLPTNSVPHLALRFAPQAGGGCGFGCARGPRDAQHALPRGRDRGSHVFRRQGDLSHSANCIM